MRDVAAEAAEQDQIGVLLVDGSPFGRSCFSAAFNGIPDIRCMVAPSIEDAALRNDSGVPIDVLVLQLDSATNCEGQIRRAVSCLPGVPILLRADEIDAKLEGAILLSGIKGCVTVEEGLHVVTAAIILVSRGMTVLPSPTLESLRKHAFPDQVQQRPGIQNEVSMLTPRQAQVLKLLLEGLSNKLIGRKLGISENTVKVHVRSIMDRAEVASRTELVLRCVVNRT